MTEEEAKTKRCPHDVKESVDPYSVDYGRSDTGSIVGAMMFSANSFCIGSKCMAWRWDCSGAVEEVAADDPRGLPAEDPRTPADVQYIGRNSPRRFLPWAEMDGYCGLAGKP